jgi:CRISPR-associated protein Cas5d
LACFTRPEFKVERVSYPVMTPSAARGLLEAILWKPAIRWHIDRIKVLAPVRFVSFRRNEVNRRAVAPKQAVLRRGGSAPALFADDADVRAQRNTVALRDVDYVIEAHFSMTELAGPEDHPGKFLDMFHRRVEKGQHFHQPCFGCREFVAEVLPADDAPSPIAQTEDLGLMLWDIDYGGDRNRAVFFPAVLGRGVLEVPANPRPAFEAQREKGGDA